MPMPARETVTQVGKSTMSLSGSFPKRIRCIVRPRLDMPRRGFEPFEKRIKPYRASAQWWERLLLLSIHRIKSISKTKQPPAEGADSCANKRSASAAIVSAATPKLGILAGVTVLVAPAICESQAPQRSAPGVSFKTITPDDGQLRRQ